MQASSRGRPGRAAQGSSSSRPVAARNRNQGGSGCDELTLSEDPYGMPALDLTAESPCPERGNGTTHATAPALPNAPFPWQPSSRSALPRAVPQTPQTPQTNAHIPRPRPSLRGPEGAAPAGQFRTVTEGPPRRPAATPVPKRLSAQLTRSLKAERDWRRLTGMLSELELSGRLDSFMASTFLTHLAQLVAKQPPTSHADVVAIERMQATLLAAVEQFMHEYRARQISNMTWALARLGLPSGAAFVRAQLLPASYPLLPWYEPQHLSNTLWALAALGVEPDDSWLEEYLTVAFVALQGRAPAPQHLANTLWALERLGVMPDQEWMAAYYDCVRTAVPASNPQDCSNILSCLALMRMHEQQPAATADLAARLAARMQVHLTADTAGAAAPTAAAAADVAVLTSMPAHSAGSGVSPPPAGGAAVDVSDQAVANGLWALAVMGMQPDGAVWEAVVGALRQRLAAAGGGGGGGMHPVALTVVVWAASTLGRPLPAAVTGLLYGKVRMAQLEAMEPRSLATMVWALATAPREQARPPPEWVADVLAVSERSLNQLGSQAVSNLLYGLCRLGARPEPAWMSAIINHFHRNLGAEASGQSLSNVLWCLAKMGYRVNSEGMDILLSLVHRRLASWQQQLLQHQQQLLQHQHQQQQRDASRQQQGELRGRKQSQQQHQQAIPSAASSAAASAPPPPPFSAQEVSNLLYAITIMRYAVDPGGELAGALLGAARARLGEANAQELSNTIWSLAALQIRPSNAWLDDFFAAAETCLPSFSPFDLAQTLYGAAKLRLPLQTVPPQPSPSTTTQATEPGSTPGTSAAVSAAASSWMSAALAAAPGLLSAASAQDLCNLSWALVQLRVPVPADSRLAAAFTLRLVSLATACEPCQLALGVWALGKWRARPHESQVQRLELATFRQVPSMRPHELAAMLSGFAGMGRAVPAEWLSDAMQQVAARRKEFGPQEWTLVVYALARVQDDPSLLEMVVRLMPRLDRLPLPSLVLIAYSCGCMGRSSTGRQLFGRCLALMAAGVAPAVESAATGSDSVGVARDAEKRAGAGAGRGFGSAKRTAAQQQHAAGLPRSAGGGPDAAGASASAAMAVAATGVDGSGEGSLRPVSVASLTATELSAVLWSAVRVGVRALPRDFLDQFYSRTEPLLEGLPASLVASYLWAAGRLRMWLPCGWRRRLLARAGAVLQEMRPQELAMCIAGLMWLRMWPSASLLRQLRTCFTAQRHQLPDRVHRHAEAALRVLAKRLARARERERRFGGRLGWLVAVRRGNVRAAAAGTTGYRRRVVAPAPAGHLSRRRALQLGVLRRAPSRQMKGDKGDMGGAAAAAAAAAPRAD